MPDPAGPLIAAVVAAAGRSTRMGTPKQLLPWRETTVIRTVVQNLDQAGAQPVVVAVGHQAHAVATELAGTCAQVVSNDRYRTGEMLHSYQVGLQALESAQCVGTLLALGDQPHIPVTVLRTIISIAQSHPDEIAIPSHRMRRGHPIYVPLFLWGEILELGADETLRRVLDRHTDYIRYITIDTPAVLRDLDTPGDYETLRPR